MNSKTLLGLGAIGGAVYLATSKKAQSKVKKTTGLSDSTKDPAKIKKLREIVKEHQYKRISGKIVDVQTANMILQVYDNLPADKKKDYAKKSIPEMARTGWSILSKSQSGLSGGEYKKYGDGKWEYLVKAYSKGKVWYYHLTPTKKYAEEIKKDFLSRSEIDKVTIKKQKWNTGV
jgi:ABC-type antimicrobial peptide transport system permease subunit